MVFAFYPTVRTKKKSLDFIYTLLVHLNEYINRHKLQAIIK